MVRRFLHYDSATGEPLGFYSDDVHDAVPEPYIEITDKDWQACLSIGGQRRYFVDTTQKALYFETVVSHEKTTEEVKAEMIAALDREYAQLFTSLAVAWATASAAGDNLIVSQRQADMVTLRSEYDTKRRLIEND